MTPITPAQALAAAAIVATRAATMPHLNRLADALTDHADETARPAIPKHVRFAVIERDGLTCQLCFEPVESDDMHLDHIQPFSLGGRETVDNLRVTHALCNMRRGAKWHADTPTSG